MGYFANLFAAAVGLEPRPNPFDERLWSPNGGNEGVSRAATYVSADSIQQLDAVAACLTALAGPLSTLPIAVFEKDEVDASTGGEQPGELPENDDSYNALVPDHPLAKLFNSKPNARQTGQEFKDEMFRHLAIWRNAYAVMTQNRETGEIAALDLINPMRVSKVEKSTTTGKIEYTVNRLGEVGSDVLTQDIVWHVRMAPLTINGLQGRPVYETQREVFGRALAVKEYGSDWFRNSGQSGGVLEHPGSFKSIEDRDKFMEGWRSKTLGLNRHSDRLLQFGVKYNPITVQNDQAQFIETDREAALAICRIWNIPPHRAGILDRATFSNIEQQGLDFVTYSIAPFISAFEQSAWLNLIIDPADQARMMVKIDVSALLRGDIKTRFAAYASGRQWGWLSVNDIRRLENQKPIPDGDRYLEPTNMQKAGAPEADPAEAEPAAEPKDGISK
jgi:HK97 family phage portal protein